MNSIKNISIAIVVTLISLKIMDLLLPYVTGKQEHSIQRSVDLREHEPLSSYNIVPENDYMLNADSLQQKEYRLNTNRDGYIVTEGESQSSEVDIIFFGGSTTEAMFVDEQYRFPVLVGQILSEKTGHDIHTLNGGFSGNHSLHSTISLLSKGIKYKPKFVILLNNVNDWVLLSKSGSYFNVPPGKSIIIEHKDPEGLYDFLKTCKDWIIPNIWDYFRSYANIRSYAKTLKQILFRHSKPAGSSADFEVYEFEPHEITSFFRSSIISFIEICKAWNITPVLMTQMSRFGPDGDLALNKQDIKKKSHYQKVFNDEIRDLGNQLSVLVIDLDEKLSGKREYIYDEIHLNSRGSQMAANMISETLLNEYGDKF